MSDVDAETLSYSRATVAQEFGLPETMAHRLHGANVAEMRRDAVELRKELGMPALDGPARDDAGRYATSSADMNAVIRRASGRR